MEDTNTVKQSRVSCSRIDEVRKSELLNAPEPLKRTGLDDTPKHALQLRTFDVEFDKIVKWIANPLLLGHSSESLKYKFIIEHSKNKLI